MRFHKEKRSNTTHRNDPEARLHKKDGGQPAKLCYRGQALRENRKELVVDGGVTGHLHGRARGGSGMTVLGRWRTIEMPDYEDDFPDGSRRAVTGLAPLVISAADSPRRPDLGEA